MPEVGRKCHVLHLNASLEQWGYLADIIACNAAADAGDKETHLGMLAGECFEVGNVFLQGFKAAHGVDAVAFPLQPVSLAPDGSEALISRACGSSAVSAAGVAAKDEDFVLGKCLDAIGSDSCLVVHFGCDV